MRAYLPSTVVLSLLVAVPLAGDSDKPSIPSPRAWVAEQGPPASCGHPLWITAAMPWPDRGAEGEWLEVVNPAPVPISVHRWELAVGARRRRLPDVTIAPGGTLRLGAEWLGTLHLRNQDGAARLLDPCGQEAEHTEWAETERGIALSRVVEVNDRPRLE